jgi:hypothetical protein
MNLPAYLFNAIYPKDNPTHIDFSNATWLLHNLYILLYCIFLLIAGGCGWFAFVCFIIFPAL